jgi:hypothetical protein
MQTAVPNRLTPLSPDDAARALAAAFERVTGTKPTRDVLALLVAQSAFETGDWSSIHNFNFGNVKAGSSFPLVTYFDCWERDASGKRIDIKAFPNGPDGEPDKRCRFRAFESATDGAEDFLRALQARPHWWAGLLTGTPAGFVEGLTTRPMYFTGDPGQYIAGLEARAKKFASYIQTHAGAAAAVAAGSGLVALAVIVGAAYLLFRNVKG